MCLVVGRGFLNPGTWNDRVVVCPVPLLTFQLHLKSIARSAFSLLLNTNENVSDDMVSLLTGRGLRYLFHLIEHSLLVFSVYRP